MPMAMVGLLQAMPGTQLFRRLTREGRVLHTGGGNNTGCELNFLPRMNTARLVEGYRSVLQRIYRGEAYFQRVREYLHRCRPRYRSHIGFAQLRVLFLSILLQGIYGKARFAYWKFLFSAATRHRRSFGSAMALAVMGYHFRKMTDAVAKAEPWPHVRN